jgi:hypothetical protein
MHALARDARAMRVLLRACGLSLETPPSQIIANGWYYFTPEVQRHLVLEVLAPGWLARTAPDPGIWTATPRD